MKRSPRQIIGDDAILQLEFEGYVVVPASWANAPDEPEKPITHDYVPNKKYPWFCAHCGYPEHERLKHTQATAQTGKALEGGNG